MTLIVSLLIFIPKILIGFAIAHLLWRDLDVPAIILKLSIGIPLGFAISASLFFVSMIVGVSPAIYSWAELLVFLLLVFIFFPRAILNEKKYITHFKPDGQDIIGISIVLVGVLLFFSAFRLYSSMHPYGLEDAWTIWNFSSRFIFRDNSPAVLLNSQFYDRFHPDYPVELSLNVAWGWFILRQETPRIPIAIALLSALAPGIVFWSALRKWKGIIPGALGALLFFIGQYLPSVVGQFAEPLFTLHLVSAVATFYGYLRSRNSGLMVVSGLLAGFSAWVKNEGILFIGVFSIVCFWAGVRNIVEWKAVKYFIIGLVAPLFVVLTYKHLAGWQSDLFSGTNFPYFQLIDISRWLLIGKSFITRIFIYVHAPISIVIVLLIYILIIGFDDNEAQARMLLFLILSGQLAGYFFIYLITPHDLQLHINTSINRLIYQLFPLGVFWIFVSLRSPTLSTRNEQQI